MDENPYKAPQTEGWNSPRPDRTRRHQIGVRLFIGWLFFSISAASISHALGLISLRAQLVSVVLGVAGSVPVAFWTDRRLGWTTVVALVATVAVVIYLV